MHDEEVTRTHLRVVRSAADPARLQLPGRAPWWDRAAVGTLLAMGSIGLAVAISVVAGWWSP
jgi:hypothetical protein